MVPSVGIGNSSGLQQTDPFNCNSANSGAANSSSTSLLSFLSAPSSGAIDPTQLASSTGESTPTQTFDARLQAFLVQLQAALGNGAVGPSASAGAADPIGATSAQASTGVDADGDQDGSSSQVGQVTGHHHGHHHHKPSAATNETNGPVDASGLQNDVNKLVNDLFSMLQQTGSSTGPISTATTASANGSSSDPSSSTTAVVSSTSTGANDPTSAQIDPNSYASIANTLSQDLLNAIQAYSSQYSLQSNQNASAAAIV